MIEIVNIADKYTWIIDTVVHESHEYKFGLAIGELQKLCPDATYEELEPVLNAFDNAMTSAMREVLERQDEDPYNYATPAHN